VAGPTTWKRLSLGEVELRARRGLRCPDGDELELSPAIRVAVLLFVHAVECFREVVLDRHRQLEGLARIAQIGFALPGEVCHLGKRSARTVTTWSRRSSLATSPSAESTPAAAGHEHRPDFELVGERAGVQRSRAAECDEGELPRVVSALDRDHAEGPQHLGVHDLERRRRIDAVERPGGRLSIELDAPLRARPANRPSKRFASVTVGLVPPRP